MPGQDESAPPPYSNTMRPITHTYRDPLELVWLHAAAQMGMQVERSAEVNASWDGAGVLTIGTPETLDPDDSLAQMILHETCHALCEGPNSLRRLDFGLGELGPGGRVHEWACLRLQAALADRYRLRRFFAATTVFRGYYDRLPVDPLAEVDEIEEREAVALAREGWERASQGPWAAAIDDALRRTAEIAQVMKGVGEAGSLWGVALDG